MILPKNTVCTLFEIKAPVWNGGKRKVGLAQNRIGEHNEIRFLYTRKDGTKSMPDNYYISGKKIRELDFDLQNIKGLTIVLVPIDQLEILHRGTDDDQEEFTRWLNNPKYANNLKELEDQ